jgi:hypothetical protein
MAKEQNTFITLAEPYPIKQLGSATLAISINLTQTE